MGSTSFVESLTTKRVALAPQGNGVGVRVIVGVRVMVGVSVMVGDLVGVPVFVRVGDRVGVLVKWVGVKVSVFRVEHTSMAALPTTVLPPHR